MIKKEIQEVLKQTLFYLAVVVGISLLVTIVVSAVGSYLEVFYQMYQYSIIFFGAFMGFSVFLSDKRQQAEDYVFTLPYSRLQLLSIKVLPRFTAAMIIYLIFLGLSLWGGEGIRQGGIFYDITAFYWIVFIIALSFSASADSYMKVGGITLLGTIILILLFKFSIRLVFLLEGTGPRGIFKNFPVAFLAICLCLLMPYIVSFFLTFKKWGTYSKENYNKNYFKLFLPLIAVGFILLTLFWYFYKSEDHYEYYVTSQHQLIETRGYSTRMVQADDDVKLKYSQGGFQAIFEDDRYVYGIHVTPTPYTVVRIHKQNHTVDTLLQLSPRLLYRHYYYGSRVFRHIIVVPEHCNTPDLRRFVFIDTRSKTIKKISTRDILPSRYYKPIMFGADVDPASGQIFWLIASFRSHKFPIIKLWEDGRAENLGILSLAFPVYVNRTLITSDEETVLRRFTDNGLEVIRKIPGFKTFHDSYRRVNLNPTSSKEIYCIQEKKNSGWVYFRLNLETLEISPVFKIKISKNYRQSVKIYPGGVYKFHYQCDEKEKDFYLRRHYLNKIYRLEGEEFKLLKEFPAYENQHHGDDFWLFPNTVVIKYNNKVSVYSLQDMKLMFSLN